MVSAAKSRARSQLVILLTIFIKYNKRMTKINYIVIKKLTRTPTLW